MVVRRLCGVSDGRVEPQTRRMRSFAQKLSADATADAFNDIAHIHALTNDLVDKKVFRMQRQLQRGNVVLA